MSRAAAEWRSARGPALAPTGGKNSGPQSDASDPVPPRQFVDVVRVRTVGRDPPGRTGLLFPPRRIFPRAHQIAIPQTGAATPAVDVQRRGAEGQRKRNANIKFQISNIKLAIGDRRRGLSIFNSKFDI